MFALLPISSEACVFYTCCCPLFLLHATSAVGTLQGKPAPESSDEEEEYQELPSSRASDAHSDGSEADSESLDGADGLKDAAVVDEGVSDLDYLKSRMKAGLDQRDTEDKTSSQTSSLTDTGQGAHELISPWK